MFIIYIENNEIVTAANDHGKENAHTQLNLSGNLKWLVLIINKVSVCINNISNYYVSVLKNIKKEKFESCNKSKFETVVATH